MKLCFCSPSCSLVKHRRSQLNSQNHCNKPNRQTRTALPHRPPSRNQKKIRTNIKNVLKSVCNRDKWKPGLAMPSKMIAKKVVKNNPLLFNQMRKTKIAIPTVFTCRLEVENAKRNKKTNRISCFLAHIGFICDKIHLYQPEIWVLL